MIGRVGYKVWSRGRQPGLRIYADTIRALRRQFIYPSDDGRYSSLDEWLSLLDAGRQPERYSRTAVVVTPTKEMFDCTLTISTLPPISPQGYVSAPIGTALATLVFSRLGRNADVDFCSSPLAETLILEPETSASLVRRQVRSARRKLRTLQKPTPRDLLEQGLYFEMIEYEVRVNSLDSQMVVDWRAPYIDSRLSVLREHNIGCDIDVWHFDERPYQCIEVKSVAGVPSGPFLLTRREMDSRLKCRDLSIEYEIVVYGFSNTAIDHRRATSDVRRVIGPTEIINEEPDTYRCW